MLMKICILGLLLVLISQIAAFAHVSKEEISRSFSGESEVDMYAITDTLVDPEEFSSFRESGKSLDAVGRFYNTLNVETDMRFLSLFDQPLSIVDFPDERRLDVLSSGEEPTEEYIDDESGQRLTDVRSFQMNENAFDFNSLKVSSGPGIKWPEVDYDSRTIPVLLGADYSSIYDVGDNIDVQYYFEDFTLVVGGFLEPDSTIFYQGELNTFLDDALVVPYPPVLRPVTEEDQEFYGILSFAMISGDLAVSRKTEAESVLQKLGAIASQSGFDAYTVLNVPTYLVQFQLTRQLIQDNAGLLIGVGILLGICVAVSNGVISLHLARRRWKQQEIEFILGVSPRITGARIVFVTAFEYVVLVVALVLLASRVPQGGGSGLIALTLTAAAVMVADISLQTVLRKRWITHGLFIRDGHDY
ncbi:hypothetical protein [Brevibacterium spongiae]|uniref:FtsX-like permease family protein n=1 Tax=Brevibacterium spongiae TaxID=2909672 RepID=A0ABY5SU84_9MICO|nr:hypothetical protein [Brevibacterium spongiae]UVI36259.1 hypothetical protein L1F31_00925 [Brevibacterium spongiae]